jgi:sodium/hydrogen antiporter
MTGLAVLGAVVLAYALVSRTLEGSIVTAPLFFVAADMLAGPDALDLVNVDVTHGTAFPVAELALALVLFSDAARVDLRTLLGMASLPGRLLGIGMPLTIALGMAAGAVLLTDLEFWEAAIVAAVVPTEDLTRVVDRRPAPLTAGGHAPNLSLVRASLSPRGSRPSVTSTIPTAPRSGCA